jgi:hypothetical protein
MRERFTVALDGEGRPITRAAHEMTPGEVVAAIDRHTSAAKQDGAARAKLARLLREIAEKHPSLRD